VSTSIIYLTPKNMKLTIATLLLSPVFASKAGKLAKFPKAKAAKSAYGSLSMSASMSMSFGPPPITVTECGEIFTDTKVVLTDNLNCGSLVDPQEFCAVTLDGPKAKINCNGNTLSQEASPNFYADGPFLFIVFVSTMERQQSIVQLNGLIMEFVSRMVVK
jgi:hypothetical protein